MKKIHFIFLFTLMQSAFAQENAIDYIMPTVNNQKRLYLAYSTSLEGDVAKLETKSSSIYIDYMSNYNKDGSITYKITHYTDGLFGNMHHAYFIKFSAHTATMAGYSKYVLKDGLFYDEVVNEEYKTMDGRFMYKVPAESYQTVNWSFTDPNTDKTVEASSYYKNLLVNGYDKRILICEFNSDGKVRKEYYMKYFGLIAIQSGYSDFYIADFKNFNLFSKTYMDGLNEEGMRELGWDILERFRNIPMNDTFYQYDNMYKKQFNSCIDSFFGLYEHMMMRNTSMHNAYRYIMSIALKSSTSKLYNLASKKSKVSSEYSSIMKYSSNYFYIRPYPESINQSGLSTYVTEVEKNYYNMCWEMYFDYMKTISFQNTFEKTYKSYLYKPMVDYLMENETKISDYYKCILFSFVATYYKNISDEGNEFLYYTKSVEFYKALTDKDKDLNVEYMKTVMKTLASIKASSETDLNRAIDATLALNDNYNASKIANFGYENKTGTGLEFGMRYAKAAYQDDVNKEYLRKAMKLLEPKLGEMNAGQIKEYLTYCRVMAPEFDCRKAESEVSKAEKREKAAAQKKDKDNKKEYRKNSRSGGDRHSNFAIMANPFAGFNLASSGSGLFKFIPFSAELRIGRAVHEFRVNRFLGFDAKNRFIGGKFSNSSVTANNGWQNLRGADYSYALVFGKNEMKSYKKNCLHFGGGFQALYGSFEADSSVVTATINKVPTNIWLRPKIKRYEGLIVFKMTIFNWKSHVSFTTFYGIGLGSRTLTYGNKTYSQEVLNDKSRTTFSDKRLVQENWSGSYLTFRMGFRFGFTLW